MARALFARDVGVGAIDEADAAPRMHRVPRARATCHAAGIERSKEVSVGASEPFGVYIRQAIQTHTHVQRPRIALPGTC